MIFPLIASLASTYAEPTTVIREMSKCSTPIQIVYSGEKSRPYAQQLADAVQSRKDFNNKKTVTVTSAQDYESGNHPAADAETVIAVITQEENSSLSPKLAALFPKATSFNPEACTMTVSMPRAKAGQITFDGLIEVPKAEDLDEALYQFMNFSTVNWRDLKLDNELKINRVSIAGTNVLSAIPNWGRSPGSLMNTILFREAFTDADSLGDQVYFWNRNTSSAVLPPPLKALADSVKLGPLSFAAIRQSQPNGHYLALYLAPSEKVLDHLADKYLNIQSIGDPGFIGQVNDLRDVKQTLTVANGIGVDRDIVTALGGTLDNDLRTYAKLGVLQHGNGGDIQGQELSNPDVASRIRSTYGVRWGLVLELSDGMGTIDYHPDYQCLSTMPSQYDQPAPSQPVRQPLFGHRMTDDEWAKAQTKYKADLADYNSKKAKYEYDEQVSWRKSVLKRSIGQLHVTLKLVDLNDRSRIVWMSDRTGKVDETAVLRTENEVVRGHMRKPHPMDCPRPEPSAPDVVKAAGAKAIAFAVKDLIGESLLPNEDVALPVGDLEIRTIAVESPIITINAGQAQGVKVGDHVTVEIFRDIVDPNTKEIIERVSVDKVTLEVVRVGKTSDCKATTPKDLDLLAKIKVGDIVRWTKS